MPDNHQKLSVCPNCGTSLKPADNFCPNCGQENHEVKLPLGHIFYEFVESITHFDNKLWNSLTAIFTSPGKMTAEFLEGKRARYVPPARLYVFVSVIFFFLIGKFADHQLKQSLEGFAKVTSDTTKSVIKLDLEGLVNNDSLLQAYHLQDLASKITISTPLSPDGLANTARRLKQANFQTIDSLLAQSDVPVTDSARSQLRQLIKLIPDKPAVEMGTFSDMYNMKFSSEAEQAEFEEHLKSIPDSQIDSLIRAEGDQPNWVLRKLYIQRGKFARLGKEENAHQLLHAITKNISVVMFILMPFVAVLLLLFYYRRGRYYYEHLIFSVHIHTVLFLLLSLALLTTFFASVSLTTSVLYATMWIGWLYFLLSLKKVYNQNWGTTVAKFLALSVLYGSIATIFLIGAFFAGILTF